MHVWQTGMTFVLVCVAWVFFRATSLHDAWYVVTHLFSGLPSQIAQIAGDGAARARLLFLGFEPSRLVLGTPAVVALLAMERVHRSGPIRARLDPAPPAFLLTPYSPPLPL